MIDSNQLTWRRSKRGRTLHYGDSAPLVTMRPDSEYPSMWRLYVGAEVTDLVNASRASDAGLAIAVAMLNRTLTSDLNGEAA